MMCLSPNRALQTDGRRVSGVADGQLAIAPLAAERQRSAHSNKAGNGGLRSSVMRVRPG